MGPSLLSPASWQICSSRSVMYGLLLQAGPCPPLFDPLPSYKYVRSPNKCNLIPQGWEICSLDKEGIPVSSAFWWHLLYVQVTYIVSCYWDTKTTCVSFQLLNLKQLKDHRIVLQPFIHSVDPDWLRCFKLSTVTHASGKHAPELLLEVSVSCTPTVLPAAPKQLSSQKSPDLELGPAVNGSLAKDVAISRWDSEKRKQQKAQTCPISVGSRNEIKK